MFMLITDVKKFDITDDKYLYKLNAGSRSIDLKKDSTHFLDIYVSANGYPALKIIVTVFSLIEEQIHNFLNKSN
jgi:hypothetical protein